MKRRPGLEVAVEALVRTSAASSGLDDQLLLNRFVADKDEAAFHALYQRHSALLWRMCRRSLDATDADEAFQAVWLVFARKAQTIRDAQALLGWLIRVCGRVIGKARKKSMRTVGNGTRSQAMDANRSADGAPGPDRRAELSEIARVIESELRELPGECRVVFELSHLEGLGRADTIRKLGLTELQYDRRIRRARDLLSRRLTRRGITLGSALTGVALVEGATLAQPVAEFTRSTAELALLARTVPLQQLNVSPFVLKLAESILAPATRHWIAVLALAMVVAGFAWAIGASTGTRTQPAVADPVTRVVDPRTTVAQRNATIMQERVLPKVRAALQTTVLGDGELTTDRAEVEDHIVYADFTAHHRIGKDNALRFKTRYEMTYDTMCQRYALKVDWFGAGTWHEIDPARPAVLWKDSVTGRETLHRPQALRDIIAAFEEMPLAEEIVAFKTRQWNEQPAPTGIRAVPGSVYSCFGNERFLYVRTADRSLWACDLTEPGFRWACIGGCPGEQVTATNDWLICNYRERIWVRPASPRVHAWRDVAPQNERVYAFIATEKILYAQRYNGDLLARPIGDWLQAWAKVDHQLGKTFFGQRDRLFERDENGTTLSWRAATLTPETPVLFETASGRLPANAAAGGRFWTVRQGPGNVPTELLSRPITRGAQTWTVEGQAVKLKVVEPQMRLRLE